MKQFYIFSALIFAVLFKSQELDSLKKQWFMVEIDTAKMFEPLATQLSDCTLITYEKPDEGKIMQGLYYVEDYLLCRKDGKPNFIYKINNGNNSYFVFTSEVRFVNDEQNNDKVMMFFAGLNAADKKQYAVWLSEYIEGFANYRKKLQIEKEEAPLRESISKMLEKPLVVYDFSFPENYSFTGFDIEIINTSKKRIKYVTFAVTGYNQVDDKIATFGGSYTKTLRGVGPVEVNGSGGWNFESIWYDNTFYSGRINSITVEYFDGSKKTFTNVGELVFSEEEKQLFDKYTNQ